MVGPNPWTFDEEEDETMEVGNSKEQLAFTTTSADDFGVPPAFFRLPPRSPTLAEQLRDVDNNPIVSAFVEDGKGEDAKAAISASLILCGLLPYGDW